MQEKSHLRTKFKQLRRELDINEISHAICENIRDFAPYKSAENVMIFYPTEYEINLLELLNDDKKFYFPRVNGVELQVCPYAEGVEFQKSSYNINEPCSNPVDYNILDLIFVPALAVDEHGFRLGYGGGFYDMFLAQCKQALTIVPIYQDFIVPNLPVESFDRKVDYIITNVKRLTVK